MTKKSAVEKPWRLNFREASLLPDIKAVRSVFFINFSLLTVTMILLFVWGFMEWQIGTLGYLISKDKKEIDFRKKSNAELLRQSAEFERWAGLINEIQGFVGIPMKPSQFLLSIGEAKAPKMMLSQMSYSIEPRQIKDGKDSKEKKVPVKNVAVYSITLSGSITGASAQATKAVDVFLDKLGSLSAFNGMKFLVKPTLKTFERDKSMELHTFIITMEVQI